MIIWYEKVAVNATIIVCTLEGVGIQYTNKRKVFGVLADRPTSMFCFLALEKGRFGKKTLRAFFRIWFFV